MAQVEEIPNVCALSGAEQSARRQSLKQGILSKADQVRELSNGYAVRFPWSQASIEDVGNLVAFESDCCPFLRFEIHVERGRGPIWLHLSGPPGAKSMLEQELLPLVDARATSHRGITMVGAGTAVSSLGAVALLCCATPLLGLFGVGAAAVYIDVGALAGITAGGLLVAVGLLFRRRGCALRACFGSLPASAAAPRPGPRDG